MTTAEKPRLAYHSTERILQVELSSRRYSTSAVRYPRWAQCQRPSKRLLLPFLEFSYESCSYWVSFNLQNNNCHWRSWAIRCKTTSIKYHFLRQQDQFHLTSSSRCPKQLKNLRWARRQQLMEWSGLITITPTPLQFLNSVVSEERISWTEKPLSDNILAFKFTSSGSLAQCMHI